MAGNKGKSKKSNKTSNKSKTSKAPLSNQQKQEVKSLVKKQEEMKIAPFEVFNQNLVISAGLNVSSGLGLTTSGTGGYPSTILPAVPAGTDNASRIGAVIRPQKLIIKYMIRAQDTTGSTTGTNPHKGKPFFVRMIIYNQRYAIDDAANNNILDKGATYGNIGSTPDSLLEPYNREDFKIYHSKTFKMVALRDTSVTPPTVENVPNNFKYCVVGKIEMKVPKVLRYSGSATLPNNFQPKLAFCVINADGTVVGAAEYRAMVNVETQLYYTDS